MRKTIYLILIIVLASSLNGCVKFPTSPQVASDLIKRERLQLAKNTRGKGYGPQSPRNIDSGVGKNRIAFNLAPSHQDMNLCNIHFHKNAEHAGGEFRRFAGSYNRKRDKRGYVYSGRLSKKELRPLPNLACKKKKSGLQSGDTIEVHYVYSSAQTVPGPTLNACLSKSIANPQLRVEAQVYVLVNDKQAHNFRRLTKIASRNGFYQAVNIPNFSGKPVVYAGSTTGPNYNEKASPLQATWSVRPKVVKVDIHSVDKWCTKNEFKEDHAHGVRNLVTNLRLLAPIN